MLAHSGRRRARSALVVAVASTGCSALGTWRTRPQPTSLLQLDAAETFAHSFVIPEDWHDEIQVITVETRTTDSSYPVPGVPGAKFTNLSAGQELHGLFTKPKLFKQWLDNNPDPNKVIVFADSADVLFGGCSQEQLMDNYRAKADETKKKAEDARAAAEKKTAKAKSEETKTAKELTQEQALQAVRALGPKECSEKEISFFNVQLGPDVVNSLCALLPWVRSLQVLDLGGCKIGDAGVEALAGALPSMRALREVHLSNNDVGEAGAKALAGALPSMRALKELNLYDNSVGDAGAEALAKVLPSMAALNMLNLSINAVGEEGAKDPMNKREFVAKQLMVICLLKD